MFGSLCPLNRSVPIQASGVIPVSQIDVANIPPIALTIPDFEGQAVLRIFSNSTQQEIGCYSATITNGASFSQPAAVGTILGIFVLVAVLASFATAVYGDHIPTMRTHYAHSLSIFVVFAILHHIFFTGALSVNWPSVLVAWWSNFAWSGGMIYSESMQNSINRLIGSNFGNLSMVGSAGAGAASDSIGGGYEISKIYKRTADHIYRRWEDTIEDAHQQLVQRSFESHIAKREATSSNAVDSPWYGKPTRPGLPIPGNYSGLAGTLAPQRIPASNAFMTGFLWLIILMALLFSAVVAFKWILELLSKRGKLRTERLNHFRNNWISYGIQLLLRIVFIAFFMMLYLIFFQFTFRGTGGATAIASLVFIGLFVGMCYVASMTCYERLRFGHYEVRPNRIHFERRTALGFLPWLGPQLESRRTGDTTARPSMFSLPARTIHYVEGDTQQTEIHQDEDFIRRRGWLFARFRRTRWWFFAAWLFYEFLRACFYGGAAGHPMAQVFGLLVVEIFALLFIVKTRPFEGARLNTLMVYLLGLSKVLTVALSAAFDPQFNLTRINTTVIGVVIIVIQGILTIALMICIVLGAVTTYFSLTRNHEDFKPRHWAEFRDRYFAHLDKAATDLPPPPPAAPSYESEKTGFDVKAVRRETKIEDEDEEYAGSMIDPVGSRVSLACPPTARASRANSMIQPDSSYGNLPFGARYVQRASWSTKDLENWQNPDQVRQSRHMSAAAGLYQSRPTSRHTSTYLNHQDSDSSLRMQAQQQRAAATASASADSVVPQGNRSRSGTLRNVVSKVSEGGSEEDRRSSMVRHPPPHP